MRLDELERKAKEDGKHIAYPLCTGKAEMIAVEPGEGDEAWNECGYCGLLEPVLEKGNVIQPSDIDLVIAPCTSFDENCNRMGMGGGFYDRYLPKCTNAAVFAAAFEVQKSKRIPADESDQPVDVVITEKATYNKL